MCVENRHHDGEKWVEGLCEAHRLMELGNPIVVGYPFETPSNLASGANSPETDELSDVDEELDFECSEDCFCQQGDCDDE